MHKTVRTHPLAVGVQGDSNEVQALRVSRKIGIEEAKAIAKNRELYDQITHLRYLSGDMSSYERINGLV